jgi:amino acid transporter
MNPVAQTNRLNPRKLALVFLCALLVGATVLYLGKSPLFLCLYCVFSAFGFYLILRRDGAGIPAACAALVCVQFASLVVFSILAVHHRIRDPRGPAGVYLPAGITLLPWYRDIFFQAAIVILCMLGLEFVTPHGRDAGNPRSRIPSAVFLALAIQGGLMHYWALCEVDSIAALSASAGGPIGRLSEITGVWLFGSDLAGLAAASVLALTSLLTLVAATLASLAISARHARLPSLTES